MPWNDTARDEHNRDHLRFPSDLIDEEWAILAPLIPPAKPGGRPRTTQMREVMNAILYIGTSGCQWRMLPGDFPPVSTVRGYFHAWSRMAQVGSFFKRHHATSCLINIISGCNFTLSLHF